MILSNISITDLILTEYYYDTKKCNILRNKKQEFLNPFFYEFKNNISVIASINVKYVITIS